MRNKYRGKCAECGGVVAPGDGTLQKIGHRKWAVRHYEGCETDENRKAYADRPMPSHRVIEWRTSGGTFYRNANGVCEDAPCCGCCTG